MQFICFVLRTLPPSRLRSCRPALLCDRVRAAGGGVVYARTPVGLSRSGMTSHQAIFARVTPCEINSHGHGPFSHNFSVETLRYFATRNVGFEMDSSFKNLVSHIEAGIAKRASRTLFEETLCTHWPQAPQKQADAIKAFAKAHGWTVAIHGQGSRATFTKL